MGCLQYAYNLLLSLTVLGSCPVWGALLLGRPKHRAGFSQRATGRVPRPPRDASRPIWYHAVSVGEVMASVPLIRLIATRYPQRPILVSTVTATGQATAKNRIDGASRTFYFPYDLPWIVDRVIRRSRPCLFITTETEIWPNCLWRLHHHGVPSVLVNGRVSETSFRRYRMARGLFRHVVDRLDLLCVQSARMGLRLREIGAPAEKIRVTGNLKFDQQIPDPVDVRSWRQRLGLAGHESVLVAGSTHPGEEEAVLRVFSKLFPRHPDLRLILAPRSPERFNEVEALIAKMGFEAVRRTRGCGTSDRPQPRVILLDTIGELAEIYGVAKVGYLGGSLVRRGGHNPLEVAAHARPVVFGPHMENFQDISELLVEEGGAVQVGDEASLERELVRLIQEPSVAEKMGANARRALMSNQGAARRTLEALGPLLERFP